MTLDPTSLATWPTFPFEGPLRLKALVDPVGEEPPRPGENADSCGACVLPDDAYVWVSDRWRVRAPTSPSSLPVVLLLESRSHLDLGDLPNLLAAELGVMIVRLERAIRSLEGVSGVQVSRRDDESTHLRLRFLARPFGRLQLRGEFLPVWESVLPPLAEAQWRANLALVSAWLGEFGGRAMVAPAPIEWVTPARFEDAPGAGGASG